MTQLYSLRTSPTKVEGEFCIVKFDDELEIEGIYYPTKRSCTCPQFQRLASHGNDKFCKHIKMIGFFERERHINDGWMFDLDTHQWRTPIMHRDILEQESYEDPLLIGEEKLVGVVAKSLEMEGTTITTTYKTSINRPRPVEEGFKRRKP